MEDGMGVRVEERQVPERSSGEDGLGLQDEATGGYVSSGLDLRLTVEPQDTVVVPGSSAMLHCAATSLDRDAVPMIKWRGEDRQPLNLIGDSYRSQLPNGSLLLQTVFPDQQGLQGDYQCVATLDNVGSIVSRFAKLRIATLPQLEKQPQDLRVFPGQTAHFTCLVSAIPPARITWLKDDRPLAIDETRMVVLPSGSLEIDEVQMSDRGSYRCNASSLDQHRLSNRASLTVDLDEELSARITAPKFITTPRSAVVTEGNNVTLDCAANGFPNPWITWLKDGISIDLADLDSRFMKVGTGSLQIINVQEKDQGTYQCRADNREDSVDATATLEVQVPPRFVKQPSDRYAFEKEDLELECEIYGKPEPKVYWMKNGDLISQNEYMQVVNGYNLKILGLMSMDAGIFQCVGSNPAGNIQAAARLIILQPGSAHPENKLFSRSDDDKTLTVAPSHSFLSTHSPAPPTDEAVAPVQDVPSAPQALTAVIVSTRFVTLSWKPPANARGEILTYSVYYRKEGSPRERIVNTTRSRLEEVNIPGLMPDRIYHFRVLAYNEHGPGASSETLEVRTQPEVHVPGPPVGLRAVATSPTSLLVQWQPPELSNGPVQVYKMFYMEEGSIEEHHIDTSDLQYELTDLNKFTEYSIWVVAFNQNGPGASTEEITARTLSDVPSEPPQNVTLEASSSTSVIVRWEPPPKEGQNGIITGYKLRYRKRDRRGRGDAANTVSTAGDRRLYALTGLERRSVYQVRLWALNVNGTGPPSEWYTVETYENDLDESQVPDSPSGLKARAMTDSITVSWSPPHNQNIMVRGYTIGWGKGIPDVYTQLLDGKQRLYVIENLEPNSEYVISLRAYNEMGDGRPIYTSVRTREEMAPEPMTPLVPPVGLMAIVLSSRSVVLYWTDTTLSKTQYVTDNRYYVVRYTSSHHSSNPRYKYFNATDLNCMIDDLKPNTQYEFTVKVVKGRRESPWSMVVLNMTQEERPYTQPRDLTVVPINDNPTMVNLNWQPPKQPNGPITGYVILYTTDSSQSDRDWVVEGIIGDRMTTTIKGLTSDTTYYFKIQARNNKGYGPFSNVVSFTTGPSVGQIHIDSRGQQIRDGRGGLSSMMILYIIIGCSVVACTVLIALVTIVCCKCKPSERSKKGYMKGNIKGKPGKTNIKPPDLWIHHDQMELKALEKTQSLAGPGGDGPSGVPITVTTLPRASQDFDNEHDSKFHHPGGSNSLDKRTYVSSYMGTSNGEEKTSTARRVIKPKPISLTGASQPSRESITSATPIPSSSLVQGQQSAAVDMSGAGGSRPMYPRTQYTISRAHVTLDQAACHSFWVIASFSNCIPDNEDRPNELGDVTESAGIPRFTDSWKKSKLTRDAAPGFDRQRRGPRQWRQKRDSIKARTQEIKAQTQGIKDQIKSLGNEVRALVESVVQGPAETASALCESTTALETRVKPASSDGGSSVVQTATPRDNGIIVAMATDKLGCHVTRTLVPAQNHMPVATLNSAPRKKRRLNRTKTTTCEPLPCITPVDYEDVYVLAEHKGTTKGKVSGVSTATQGHPDHCYGEQGHHQPDPADPQWEGGGHPLNYVAAICGLQQRQREDMIVKKIIIYLKVLPVNLVMWVRYLCLVKLVISNTSEEADINITNINVLMHRKEKQKVEERKWESACSLQAQSPENPYSLQGGYDTVASLPSGGGSVGPPHHHTQGVATVAPYSTGTQQSSGITSDSSGSSTMGKRLQGHPLKSFSVPAPPPQSAPSTPQQKHVVSSVTVRPQGSSSPYKKAGILSTSGTATPPPPSSSSKGRGQIAGPSSADDPNRIQPSYSTEELNQEMANLEGLMKDLNAITASEFEC
ncbi:neogenin [Anabrus simplex]|uniref:neogenin n=1 Tax=Anabrus simplex TaxID=316456 RepID=UPI0035A3650E